MNRQIGGKEGIRQVKIVRWINRWIAINIVDINIDRYSSTTFYLEDLEHPSLPQFPHLDKLEIITGPKPEGYCESVYRSP